MSRTKQDAALASSLVAAVFLWGGNNTGIKFIVATWPPVWTGASRFLCAGLIMLALFRWTHWLGTAHPLTPSLRRRLWLRGGLSLAVYIVAFNTALRFTSASHVALYLGAAPVWALLWEELPTRSWSSVQRYGAALLALSGVFILFLPVLRHAGSGWIGELLALAASVLWTHFGRQCRALGASLSGAEVSAHTMWRAGVWMMPVAGMELWQGGLVWRTDIVLIQLYCVVFGGVVAFAMWNNGLRHWPTSRVLLFNNLIPLSTATWAHFCLGEPMTPTFWAAMALIVGGVALGQAKWQRALSPSTVPPE